MMNQSTIDEYKKLKAPYRPAFIAAYLASFVRENIDNIDSEYFHELLDLVEMIVTEYTSDTPLEMSEFEREIIKIMRENKEKEE